MKKTICNILVVTILILTGCEDKWAEHYENVPEGIDMNVWDAIKSNPELSVFSSILENTEYDTLFETNNTYTVFIPTNSAINAYSDTGSVTETLLNYHLSPHFIHSGNIKGKRKVQTLGEKYMLLENNGEAVTVDAIPLNYESPLYKNGKFFILDQVAVPLPNIYEYISKNMPILKEFIDDKDSIILDKENSRPLGYDSEGNTIFDTVSIEFNIFELEYFPVSEELRNKTATLVFPSQTDYNNALTEMAVELGGNYIDYNDIPKEWQLEVLVPYLIERGVFENMMEPVEFVRGIDGDDTLKVKNILGDSIALDYDPTNKVLCSNGYVYSYEEFTLPDTLINGAIRIEGESLLETKGSNNFAWDEEVDITSDISLKPVKAAVQSASNDSILRVKFTEGYEGNFSVEWNIENVFPRKYLMVVKTNILIGGIYDIYVNDALVKTVNYYDQFQKPGATGISQSVTGDRYVSTSNFNLFDCWVENEAAYGEAKIRFEYVGPGEQIPDWQLEIENGLSIDYIDFIPQTN